jgi:hypothetical protein
VLDGTVIGRYHCADRSNGESCHRRLRWLETALATEHETSPATQANVDIDMSDMRGREMAPDAVPGGNKPSDF